MKLFGYLNNLRKLRIKWEIKVRIFYKLTSNKNPTVQLVKNLEKKLLVVNFKERRGLHKGGWILKGRPHVNRWQRRLFSEVCILTFKIFSALLWANYVQSPHINVHERYSFIFVDFTCFYKYVRVKICYSIGTVWKWEELFLTAGFSFVFKS